MEKNKKYKQISKLYLKFSYNEDFLIIRAEMIWIMSYIDIILDKNKVSNEKKNYVIHYL